MTMPPAVRTPAASFCGGLQVSAGSITVYPFEPSVSWRYFSNYIMFGSGVTGEIVVSAKQRGKIVMDVNAEYRTGARL